MENNYNDKHWNGKKIDLSADDLLLLFVATCKAVKHNPLIKITPEMVNTFITLLFVTFNAWFDDQEACLEIVKIVKQEIGEMADKEAKEKNKSRIEVNKVNKTDRIAELLDELMSELKK